MLLGGVAVLLGVLAGALDHGHGCAQLVGGVGGELGLRLKGPLQPGKHAVEGARQPGELVAARRHLHPTGQIGGLVDGVGGGGELLQGPEGPPGDEVAPQGGQQDEQGHGHHRHEQQVGDGLGIVRGLQQAPHPHAPVPAGGYPEVQHVITAGGGVHRPGQAVLKGLLGGEGHGHLPGQQGLPLAVYQGVHPVDIELEALPQPEGAVVGHLHLGQVGPHRGVQLVHGGLRGHRAADAQQEGQQQPGHQCHEEHIPDGDLNLDAHPLHGVPSPSSGGSRSTQPTPRRVWMSLWGRPSSIFLRRRLMYPSTLLELPVNS